MTEPRLQYGTIDDATRRQGDGLAISLLTADLRRQFDRFVQQHKRGDGAVFKVTLTIEEGE